VALKRRSRADVAKRARERGALAAVVAARRQELGLTQVELADLAGVSARFVHAIEAGRTEVGLDRLLAVLDTLGLHLQVDRGQQGGVVASSAIVRLYGLDTDGEASP
jgi:HTH-type transcriptional regulator/antitoxin HipB